MASGKRGKQRGVLAGARSVFRRDGTPSERKHRSQHIPIVLFLAMLGFAGLLLQAKYSKKQFEKIDYSWTCPTCSGAGLDYHDYPPRFTQGAVPHLYFVMLQLNQGKSLEDLVCPDCAGIGTQFKAGHSNKTNAEGMLPLAKLELRKARTDLPYRKQICNYCFGTGHYGPTAPIAMDHQRLCEACFGIGHRFMVDRHEGASPCIPCQGMGRIVDEHTAEGRTCLRCDGFGTITLD